MALTYIGEFTIGEVLPGVTGALLAAQADLEARIAACAQFAATVGLDITGQLTVAAQITSSLQLALSLGITAPSISVQIGIMAALVVALQAQLQIILDLFGLFATAGVHAYAYDGTASAFGGEVTAALTGGFPGGTGGAQHCNALVLATTVGATWTAMGSVFKLA